MWISDFASSLLKYQKETKLGAQKFHFPKDKKLHFCFLGRNVFIFQVLAEKWRVLFLGIKKCFLLGKYKEGFLLTKYRKPFSLRKYKHFLILQLESSISGNIRKFSRCQFFCFFWDWDGKCIRWPSNHTTTG